MATREQLEFGDFQTPPELAAAVLRRLSQEDVEARTVVEPTCGRGEFLAAAAASAAGASGFYGWDISADYVAAARGRLRGLLAGRSWSIAQADFFDIDWTARLLSLPQPCLVLGNPPWINASRMSLLRGSNLPAKSRQPEATGIDALTGKSNFDVGEAMLSRLVDALQGRPGALAMLCKVAAARKVLQRAWRSGYAIQDAALYRIDAQRHFGASVDACLLVCRFGAAGAAACRVYPSLESRRPESLWGWRQGRLVADVAAWQSSRRVLSGGGRVWRSGVKHDCAKVFELRREGRCFRNGFDQLVELDDACLFPLLKGSCLARGADATDRWLLVTQRAPGDDTGRLRDEAARTWKYLQQYAALLDRRRSAVYRGRSRFAMFGIGSYSFAPWKIAVSGLHKSLHFVKIGPREGKPAVLDDTCYFLPCRDEAEADRRWQLLHQPAAQRALQALVFWDAKRPITAEVLNAVDLDQLALHAGPA